MGSGVYGMSWEPGPPARHTSARAAWRPQNLDDGAMKKLLVGAAAFGCRRGPSGADKTEIPDHTWLVLLNANDQFARVSPHVEFLHRVKGILQIRS